MIQPSSRFGNAVYFCRVCDYHVLGVSHARGHMLSDDHRSAIEVMSNITIQCFQSNSTLLKFIQT